MLIDEAAAKMKFCPLQRTAVPLIKDGSKFASGVNVSGNGPLTLCEGSQCMLWETHTVLQESKELPCHDCEGKSETGCAKCGGKGKYTIQIPHQIGFCGTGFNGPLTAGLTELNKTLAAILVTVRGQLKKNEATDTPPAPAADGGIKVQA